MRKPKKYYQLVQSNADDSADLYIFGDISSWPSDYFGDKSAWSIVKELGDLDAAHLHVHINSYGGDVAEGLAIYNVLKNHSAEVITHCDGFACSAASVVFMAGEERIMSPASLLMVHNAWTIALGNAEELRKTADDIETITQASVNAYKAVATIDESKIKELMDNETWILPEDALEYGFATSIDEEIEEDGVQQSAFRIIRDKLISPEESEPEVTIWADGRIYETLVGDIAKGVVNNIKEFQKEQNKPSNIPPEPESNGWDKFFNGGK